ncbi:EMP/nonaspanin domain family protein [Cardiosporidium cionae]|uniref:Transmembrane 9 superfamily member n=1 Tax=Cardiosporidium cionae TaxID=476202 RepID=A0ABQ7JB27_9APIC|nr:EMP/nonaspanin domain family protein [Cardiosporidium cionae]|eukprot:KAF8821164.1 EMP/nonaspanin domain family protein [Cardiosporidium cionae]
MILKMTAAWQPGLGLFSVAVNLILSFTYASAWIFPGSYPMEHLKGDLVKIKVNSLSSISTQVPYDYYYAPYPRPEKIVSDAENLGEILTGDTSQNSLYEAYMLKPEKCKTVGNRSILMTEDKVELFEYLISRSYFINLSCEDLPASTPVEISGNPNPVHILGTRVGFTAKQNFYINNHISFYIYFHQPSERQNYRIVGFEVHAQSMNHIKEKDGSLSCDTSPLALLDEQQDIYFTYDVSWVPSSKRWASRWDTYIQSYNAPIHWFSIVNALVIVLFLGIMIAMILLRTLLRDIARYNSLDNVEDTHEEWGWKLLHGDVFRKPTHYSLLSVCVGTGVQILGITLVTAILASIGIFSPAFRGSLLQSSLVFFGFMGLPAGYASASCYKIFDKTPFGNLRVPLMTAFLFPEIPVLTNKIPRAIPPQHWLVHPFLGCIIGGILPFGAVFTELIFIMSSLWLRRFYFLFGFLLSVIIILIIACAEISIALTYFRLVAEDYRWWWPSFLFSSFSAIYIFAYCIIYFLKRLPLIGFVPVILYFGYMFLLSYGFFLLTGTCGFIATFYFLRSIYSSVKVD